MSWYTTDEITFPENFPFFSFFHFPILKNLLHMTSTNSCERFLEAISTVAVTNTHTHVVFQQVDEGTKVDKLLYLSGKVLFILLFSVQNNTVSSPFSRFDYSNVVLEILLQSLAVYERLAGGCKSNSCKSIFFLAD